MTPSNITHYGFQHNTIHHMVITMKAFDGEYLPMHQ